MSLPKQLCPTCNSPEEVRARIAAGSKTGLVWLKSPCMKQDDESPVRCCRKVGHAGRCAPGCEDCVAHGRVAAFGQLAFSFDTSGQSSLIDLFEGKK